MDERDSIRFDSTRSDGRRPLASRANALERHGERDDADDPGRDVHVGAVARARGRGRGRVRDGVRWIRL